MSCCPTGSHGYLAADHKDAGRVATLAGVEVYETGKLAEKLVLFLPDVWGWNSGRLRAVMDEFAERNGAFCAVAKVMKPLEGGTDDDALPPFFSLEERFPDLQAKLQAEWHAKAVGEPVKKVLQAYADQGVKQFSMVSFCYGAWVGFHLASGPLPIPATCATAAHPSVHLEQLLGGDMAGLARRVQVPWLLMPSGAAGAEGADPEAYDAGGAVMEALEASFPGQNKSLRFATEIHGFVTRGDISNGTASGHGEGTRASVAKAVAEIVSFLKQHKAL